MNQILQLVQFIGRNGVPLWGVAQGWSPVTLLAVFWFENFVGGLLIAARIHLHRRATNKRGHFMVEKQVGRRKIYGYGNFLQHFLVIAVLFSAAHGFFLAAIGGTLVMNGRVQLTENAVAIGGALLTTLVSLLIGFGGDLLVLRERPFAWIRSIRNRALGRTFLLHMTIIIGMFAVSFTNRPALFLTAFIVIKMMFDAAALLPWSHPGDAPPPWLQVAMKKPEAGEPLEDHESFWIDRWKTDDAAAKEAELTISTASTS